MKVLGVPVGHQLLVKNSVSRAVFVAEHDKNVWRCLAEILSEDGAGKASSSGRGHHHKGLF